MSEFWADKRVEIGYEKAKDLANCYNRDNWRGHPTLQRDATKESLDTLGWVGQPKINKRTGNMMDGHLRVELALLKNPEMMIPVDYYDLSEEEEDLALQILNAITEMAEPIPDKFKALMERTREMVANKPALRGMLEGMRTRLSKLDGDIDYDEMWQGMPEFEQDDLSVFRTIKVHFNSQDEVDSFAKLLGREIADKARFIYFDGDYKPSDLKSFKYITDES